MSENKEKPKLSYILEFPNSINLMSEAMSKSIDDGKYKRNEWKKGCPLSKSMDSALRHLTSFMNGKDLDSESGSSNLACAANNILFMIENYERLGEKIDDRDKSNEV